MLLEKLYTQSLIHPPKWLIHNTMYLTIMGSNAYAVTSDNSDWDIYGFCIPPKDDVFPHLRGEILGFGNQIKRFENWQEHHVVPEDKKQMFDFSVYSIVKYFQLCMENNPNMIDSLFTPRNCVLHSTQIGEHVRSNRNMFLHKGAWHKFKGYAYAQMSKIRKYA
jgi:predicted nucleotidyltransferase